MNYSEIIHNLQQASLFELYRLYVAIRNKMDDPEQLRAVRACLRIGQIVEYYDWRKNTLVKAKVLKLNSSKVLLEHVHDGEEWNTPYYMICLDGVSIEINEQKKQGLGRNEIRIGELLGFVDRNNQEQVAVVERLNPKTVTLHNTEGSWRVPYSLLFKVIDGDCEQADGSGQGRLIHQ